MVRFLMHHYHSIHNRAVLTTTFDSMDVGLNPGLAPITEYL